MYLTKTIGLTSLCFQYSIDIRLKTATWLSLVIIILTLVKTTFIIYHWFFALKKYSVNFLCLLNFVWPLKFLVNFWLWTFEPIFLDIGLSIIRPTESGWGKLLFFRISYSKLKLSVLQLWYLWCGKNKNILISFIERKGYDNVLVNEEVKDLFTKHIPVGVDNFFSVLRIIDLKYFLILFFK